MPKSDKPRKKRRIAARLDLHQWIEQQIERGKFQNFSDAIEIALEKLRDSERDSSDERQHDRQSDEEVPAS
jgi:Arc/MetJ-type ribon-helix-helix transcriptional regulator